MPERVTPLVNNYYYHVFNRSVAKIPIFIYQDDYIRALELLDYYRFKKPSYPYSKFRRLPHEEQSKYLLNLEKSGTKMVDINCFCLMPNHFHLLLKQLEDNGIEDFLRYFQDSYAKYFNIKKERVGALFQSRFKVVLIEDGEQLLHVSRYIHLNPYSSLIVRKKVDLLNYPWSSFSYFLQDNNTWFCSPTEVLNQFNSKKEYQEFVFDRADYQKKLKQIEHLLCE